jgi:glucose-6-phosphate isomerase
MKLTESDYPKSVEFDFSSGEFSPREKTVERHVSDLGMMFNDKAAVKADIDAGDPLVYEIFYYGFPTSKSDMALGTTRIQPGTVGNEYYMTKGHFHEADDQPEIYFCVQGEGYLIMETIDGEFRAEKWQKGTITHIPPMWAHRAINTGDEPLVFVATYHLSAGHTYDHVAEKGFSKRIIKEGTQAIFIDNPQRK